MDFTLSNPLNLRKFTIGVTNAYGKRASIVLEKQSDAPYAPLALMNGCENEGSDASDPHIDPPVFKIPSQREINEMYLAARGCKKLVTPPTEQEMSDDFTQQFHARKNALEMTSIASLRKPATALMSRKLTDAFNNCGMDTPAFDWNTSPSFTLYRKIWQAVTRCAGIEAMGLSGMSATMFTDERQEHRDLQVWLRQVEQLLGETNMRVVYTSLNGIK